MRVQSISDNQFKQFIQLHIFYGYIALLTISYFLSEIMSTPPPPLVMIEGGIKRSFAFFSRKFHRCHHKDAKSMEKIFKKLSLNLLLMVRQQGKF